MKPIVLLSAIFLLAMNTFAGDNIPPTTQLLQNSIVYPDYAKQSNEEGTVLVQVIVDENGKIQIVECNSDNESLKKYVISKLCSLELPFTGQNKEEINLKFIFKLF